MTFRFALPVLLSLASAAYGQFRVVNGASFQDGLPVPPGSLVSVLGTFNGVATGQAAALPMPTTLNGVAVSIDGVSAPVY